MRKLRIHYFQHVPFEGLGYIENWAEQRKHLLTSSKFYEDYTFPALEDVDWLIVMGGPMGAYDEDTYPWMAQEKLFIKHAIDAGKIVVGICLGAQLIASTLGARVYKNGFKEIGWFPVQLTKAGQEHHLLNGFEKEFDVFHWHGDTFDLPANAINLMQSEACKHQAFVVGNNVLALQFHFEFTESVFDETIQYMRPELVNDKFIQTESDIMARKTQTLALNPKLKAILENLEKGSS